MPSQVGQFCCLTVWSKGAGLLKLLIWVCFGHPPPSLNFSGETFRKNELDALKAASSFVKMSAFLKFEGLISRAFGDLWTSDKRQSYRAHGPCRDRLPSHQNFPPSIALQLWATGSRSTCDDEELTPTFTRAFCCTGTLWIQIRLRFSVWVMCITKEELTKDVES